MQFALILLLLFATGYRPAELVDAKKKKKRTAGLDNNETCADDMNNQGFDDSEVGANADFGFDSDDDHDSTIADLGFEDGDDDNDGDDEDVAISDAQTEVR